MVEIISEFYLVDIDYKTLEDSSVIRLFGIDDNGKYVTAIDKGFKPYFWAEPENPEGFVEKLRDLKSDDFKITDLSIEDKKFLGKDIRAVKITVDQQSSIQKISEIIRDFDGVKKTYGKEMSLSKRYLIDKDLYPLTKVRVQGENLDDCETDFCINVSDIKSVNGDMIHNPSFIAFDIETYNFRGNPRAEIDPVMMISFSYSDGRKKVVTWKRFENAPDYVEFVQGEMEMIKRFVDIIKKEKPTFIVGYNSDGFDMEYLRVRAKKYNIELDMGWDGSSVESRRSGRYQSSRIKGTIHIDIYRFIRTALSQKMKTETYDLNSVANELLGEEKKEINWEEMFEMWDKGGEDLKKLVEYCMHDSYLAHRLFEELMPLLFELTKLIGLTPFTLCRTGISQYAEWYMIRMVNKLNEVVPNKPGSAEMGRRMTKTFIGAFVFEPKPGLYENITIFDFRSLYPSIIVSHNISLDTLDCDCCKIGYKTPKIDGKKYKFCKNREGFIPMALKGLIERRGNVKKILSKTNKKDPEYQILDARSEALKLVANGYYGYLGFAGARWYCLECAEATTAFGRKYITDTINKAEKKGFNVIYSDTDSVAISLGEKKKEDVFEFVKEINKKLPGMMQLEFEDFYPRGIFVSIKGGKTGAKKKYVMVNDEGDIIVKGFEFVRRDWSDIAKKTQMKVFEAILKENDKNLALDIVHDTIRNLREQKVPIQDVEILTQLKKEIRSYDSVGPHVAAAKRGQERGFYAKPGAIIKYVVCKGKGSISERSHMTPIVIEDKLEYDPEYYINNQVLPAVERILQVLGFSDNEIQLKEQTELDKYF
jgi:DNA polymerase I